MATRSMSPSSTAVHGGQHDTKHVTFELLLHAECVADKKWVILARAFLYLYPYWYERSNIRRKILPGVLFYMYLYIPRTYILNYSV